VNRIGLVDTGPLVAMLDRREKHHSWAVEQMSRLRQPLSVCEAVVTEAYYLLRQLPAAQSAILEMLAADVLRVSFHLAEHVAEVLGLVQRYANVPMALADACLVRMSELMPDAVIFTLDRDFRIFRRHRRQKIPLLIPPDQ
jgi:predicted nucleic acid-binding protein